MIGIYIFVSEGGCLPINLTEGKNFICWVPNTITELEGAPRGLESPMFPFIIELKFDG